MTSAHMMGTQNSSGLLERIESFDIDDGPSDFSFEARLAVENGWSRPYARRVVTEYKRFAYLAMTAGHPVTPSDQVDQAWHLHLTYTRSYWERFCRGVLPKPLHHDPTRGGAAEDHKFTDWYSRTRESYARAFGTPPPSDIWPDAETRFSDVDFRRVSTLHHWVVPKEKVRRGVRLGLVLGVPTVALAGCAPLLLGNGDGFGGHFMAIGAIMIVGVAALVLRSFRRQGGGRCGPKTGSRDDGCGSSGWWFWGGDWGSGGHSGEHGGGHSGGDCGGSGDGSGGCGSSGCGGGGCGGGGD